MWSCAMAKDLPRAWPPIPAAGKAPGSGPATRESPVTWKRENSTQTHPIPPVYNGHQLGTGAFNWV